MCTYILWHQLASSGETNRSINYDWSHYRRLSRPPISVDCATAERRSARRMPRRAFTAYARARGPSSDGGRRRVPTENRMGTRSRRKRSRSRRSWATRRRLGQRRREAASEKRRANAREESEKKGGRAASWTAAAGRRKVGRRRRVFFVKSIAYSTGEIKWTRTTGRNAYSTGCLVIGTPTAYHGPVICDRCTIVCPK